jgi:hypothetical protein
LKSSTARSSRSQISFICYGELIEAARGKP